MDNFPLTPTNQNEPSLNKPSSPQPEDFQCDDLSSYNTLTLPEEERPNDYSEFWQDPAIQAEFNKLVNMIAPKTSNPDSCTAPTTNMPIAATQPEGLETKDEPSLAPPTSLKQYDQADSTLTKPELNELDYIRTCLYALCEPLIMYWRSPISKHITISILKTPEYKRFKDNVEEYLQALCLPPSSDGQHELQSTIYKEKWNEFYNEARIAINELLKSSHTTVKNLQLQNIKIPEALNHHRTNTIDPIYSKIKKLCELPLYQTQQEALTSLFLEVYKYYTSIGSRSIKSIGKKNNFKYCPEIPELKDLFSVKHLKQKIENLITYIDNNTDPNNLIVIDKNSMINPKFVNMIKDIIIEKIKQDPDYQCDMPIIKFSVRTNDNESIIDNKCYALQHTKAHPLVITCQLDADESNTLTKDQQDKVNTLLDAACKQINEQFTVALDHILSNTSQNKSRNKKKLKQLESQATMAPMPVEQMFMPQMPMAPRTVEPMFMPQMFMAPMPKTNIKRQHTSPGLSPSTEPQTPSKKRKHSNTPPSTPPK